MPQKREVVTQQKTKTRTRACHYRGSCPSNSAKDGGSPPVQHQVAHLSEGSTREEAKAREHAVDNVLVQRRSHTSAIGYRMREGTSRASANASCRTTSMAWLLHRPPVSIAMTTSRLFPVSSSGYVASLSARARASTARSTSAALE